MVHSIHSVVDWWMWLAFTFPVLILLLADMLLTGGNRWHHVTMKEAAIWSVFWIGLALVFNFLLWLHLYDIKTISFAHEHAIYFFTGYIVEELISIENMIAVLLIIQYFKVPEKYQRKVLLYGVVGAIACRFILLLIGVSLVSQMYWLYYVFGCFLIYSGAKIILFMKKETIDLSKSKILKLIYSTLKTTEQYHGSKIFVKTNEIWYVTPIFVVLALIQASDIAFAVTSIPAIFGITQDPFIIYTSNILAVLGLRSLYFLMENLIKRFYFLKHSISIILIYIGGKMLVSPWLIISIYTTLGVILSTIVLGIVASIIFKSKN